MNVEAGMRINILKWLGQCTWDGPAKCYACEMRTTRHIFIKNSEIKRTLRGVYIDAKIILKCVGSECTTE
jgi:hypothetical protein